MIYIYIYVIFYDVIWSPSNNQRWHPSNLNNLEPKVLMLSMVCWIIFSEVLSKALVASSKNKNEASKNFTGEAGGPQNKATTQLVLMRGIFLGGEKWRFSAGVFHKNRYWGVRLGATFFWASWVYFGGRKTRYKWVINGLGIVTPTFNTQKRRL